MAEPSAGTESMPSSGKPAGSDHKKNIVVLKNRSDGPFGAEQTIYLCGTSHVSKKSCDDVRQLIQAVKPQVVMLELCNQRKNLLNPVEPNKEHVSTKQHIQLWREGKQPLLAIVYSWMLSQVAEKCEITPGEEFRVALEEAIKAGFFFFYRSSPELNSVNATFHILTLKIALETSNVTGKEMEEIMQSLTEDEDVLTEALKDFGKQYPKMLRPLIEERDEYMVWTLRRLATQAQTVVAVVGAGHLKGMQEKWDAEINFEELNTMPASKKVAQSSTRKWTHIILVTTAGSAAFASIIYALQWRKLQ